MKRFFKILLWSILALVLLSGLFAAGFIYKIKNGFPVSYETDAPLIDFPEGKINVLLFSKSTAFRHGESIEAGKKVFEDLSKKNNWFLYSTEEGGVFNPEQLAKFHVVVFNNSTGRVLTDEQQKAFENYVEQGGRMIGIHGSGDDSHHWDWYVQNLVGSEFSHHPIDPQLQEAQVSLEQVPDSADRARVARNVGHIPMNGMSSLKIRGLKVSILFTALMEKKLIQAEIFYG